MFPLLAACGELPQEGERELEFPTRFHERLADAMHGEGKKSRRQGKTRPWRRRTHHRFEGAQERDKGRQGETRSWRRRTHHPYQGVQRRQGETRFQLSR